MILIYILLLAIVNNGLSAPPLRNRIARQAPAPSVLSVAKAIASNTPTASKQKFFHFVLVTPPKPWPIAQPAPQPLPPAATPATTVPPTTPAPTPQPAPQPVPPTTTPGSTESPTTQSLPPLVNPVPPVPPTTTPGSTESPTTPSLPPLVTPVPTEQPTPPTITPAPMLPPLAPAANLPPPAGRQNQPGPPRPPGQQPPPPGQQPPRPPGQQPPPPPPPGQQPPPGQTPPGPSPGPSPPSTPSSGGQDITADCLTVHNAQRAQSNLPPFQTAAANIISFARTRAQEICTNFAHRTISGFGENIAFQSGNVGCSAAVALWQDPGHLAQIVSTTNRYLACGKALCTPPGQSQIASYFACEYGANPDSPSTG